MDQHPQPTSADSLRPLNIGLLAPAFRGFNALDGGIGSHFADLAAGLAEQGQSGRVITPAPPAGFIPAPPPPGVRFVTFEPTMPRWLNRVAGLRWQLHSAASWWWRARQASAATLASHKLEPIDCIETSSSGLLAMTLLKHSKRPPVVTRISTTSGQLVTHNAGATGWLDRNEQKWERQLVARSDALVTHTLLHRDEIVRQWGFAEESINLVTHGIDLPLNEQLTVPSSQGKTGFVHVLYVGRFEHRKGTDVLLAAIPGVLARAPNTQFLLIGQDADNHAQNRFWLDNPTISRKQVIFAGKTSSADLQNAYRDCDLFVAPSRYESFGLIYVEAMAWAKPVIGCRAGGISEVISDGETGLLAEPGDVSTLTAALLKLINDPSLRTSMGAAARGRVKEHFSRTALARKTVGLFRRVIADVAIAKLSKAPLL